MKAKNRKPGIIGMGFYFPSKTVKTKVIADEINLSAKLYQYIGIDKIYYPDDDDQPTKMAYLASENALTDAEILMLTVVPYKVVTICITAVLWIYLLKGKNEENECR